MHGGIQWSPGLHCKCDTAFVHNIFLWGVGVARVSVIRPGILRAWVRAAKDPDEEVVRWLEEEAPAGVRNFPANPGIFPNVDGNEQAVIPELNVDELGDFLNYSSVEMDDAAWPEIEKYINKGLHQAVRRPRELSSLSRRRTSRTV